MPVGVAPYVGAWIETDNDIAKPVLNESHPMWVRGLKRVESMRMIYPDMSHPMWVRGLKLLILSMSRKIQASHPMWVRGLKLIQNSRDKVKLASHPMWVRGLKQGVEMATQYHYSRTLCGCVD